MSRKLISIIVPVYNEASNLPCLYDELVATAGSLAYRFEFIFVNDGSCDNSAWILARLGREDARVNVIELTRNFGKEIATTAGLNACSGDAAVMMDADMQHPPELLPEFVGHWEKGAAVVVGVRKGNEGVGWFRAGASSCFYVFLNKISKTRLTPHATDYRLLDRVVIDEFNRFTERLRLTRGLIDWLGFERSYVYFVAPMRKNGKSRLGYVRLMRLAASSIVSLSLAPLKVAGYMGIFLMMIFGPLGLFVYINQFVLRDPWHFHFSGPAALAILMLFSIGLVLSCIGLLALYIATIHGEVIGRPLYVVRRRKAPVGPVAAPAAEMTVSLSVPAERVAKITK